MIEHKQFNNGFAYLEISNTSACARIALQGAHLFHFQGVGEEPLLWVSEKSFFTTGKGIRGGVPICWPWFGKHTTENSLPQHGFARIFPWQLLQVKESDASSTEVTLQLQTSEESLQLWPFKFTLLLHITIAKSLRIALTSKNCDTKPFEISSALHSYFMVADIDTVTVEGLANKPYFNKVTGENSIQQGAVSIAEEIDRIYQKVDNPVLLHDRERTVSIEAQGSSSVVVWNPWIEKSTRMSDMQNDAYKTMLCIETANASEDSRMLLPDKEHTLSALIS